MPRAKNPHKGVPTTARIHPEVHRAIEKIAKNNKRKTSSEIDYACEAWARAHGELTGSIER